MTDVVHPAQQQAKVSTLKAAVRVLTEPSAFFTSVADQQRFGPPLLVALLACVTSIAIVLAFAGLGVVPIPAGKGTEFLTFTVFKLLELAVIGPFIGGAVLHLVARMVGGEGSYRQSVAIAAYSMAMLPFTSLVGIIPVPHLGLLLWLYGFYLSAHGVIVLHRTPRTKTFVAFALCGVAVVSFAMVALHRAKREHEARQGRETAANSGVSLTADDGIWRATLCHPFASTVGAAQQKRPSCCEFGARGTCDS
jgi:hypothetical protein